MWANRSEDLAVNLRNGIFSAAIAFAPAHIIIKDLGYVAIIYQVWSKDMSISLGAFEHLSPSVTL